ncbi:SapC family protein [Cellvibrio sp.]
MGRHVVLNNIEHKDLKVITRYSAAFGYDVSNVLTFVTEFSAVHKEYPIFFHADPKTHKLRPVAMLGFDDNENLFLDEHGAPNGWRARYIPAFSARGPFLIGFQNQLKDGGDEHTPVIHLDIDDQRLSEHEGEAIFLPLGGNSEYLNAVNHRLQLILQGLSLNDAMIAAFSELDLIEPVNLQVQFDNHHEYRIHGYHTVDKQKLAALASIPLARLNAAGFLEAAHYMISSLENIPALVELKNKKCIHSML